MVIVRYTSRFYLRWPIFGLLLLSTLLAAAQDSTKTHVKFLDRPFFTKGIIGRAIRAFDEKDTLYCESPRYNFSAMISADAQVQPYALHTPAGVVRMGVPAQVSFSPHFGWRWIVYGYSVAKIGNTGRQTTQHLSFYARPLGGDLCYQYNKTGSFSHHGAPMPDCLSTLLTGHLYYIFNHRRFNYSTQQAQGSPQRRSAGSWLLGIRYDHQNVLFKDAAEPLCGEVRQLYHSIGVTTGYAYNWVFAPGWVLGGGLQPGIGLAMWRTGHQQGRLCPDNAFQTSAIARLGLMWTDGQWFAGASAVSHNYVYTRAHSTMTNSLNYFSLYAGLKFGLRKQYRKAKQK